MTTVERETSLRIHIDNENALAQLNKSIAEINRRSSYPDAPFFFTKLYYFLNNQIKYLLKSEYRTSHIRNFDDITLEPKSCI